MIDRVKEFAEKIQERTDEESKCASKAALAELPIRELTRHLFNRYAALAASVWYEDRSAQDECAEAAYITMLIYEKSKDRRNEDGRK